MKKPTIKKEVAIDSYFPESMVINLYATPDAIEDIKEFGKVSDYLTHKNLYCLRVDARYDFDEVLAYLNHYDTESGGE